jgi:signal transduction histidine kinase
MPRQPAERPLAPPVPGSIRAFESELDAFDFALLDAGHFVIYRNVWRSSEATSAPGRIVQGAVLERTGFLHRNVAEAVARSGLDDGVAVSLAYRGETLEFLKPARHSVSTGAERRGDLLHSARLSAPFADLEVVFSASELDAAAAVTVLAWILGVFVVLLGLMFWLTYRLGAGYIALSEQQQDFVSAISHELKTPLTSIRMHSEMLRAGWVDESKRAQYYEDIHSESERLSRLIDNVLQLARMRRSRLPLQLQQMPLAELLQRVMPPVVTRVEQAGFVLEQDILGGSASGSVPPVTLRVDPDALAQVLLNLVDNAVKFAADAEPRRVILQIEAVAREVIFRVRDFGPGIPADQRNRIFELFYRSEAELTRETSGTGIGLALVKQLVAGMGGRVAVGNADPGAEFTVTLPAADAAGDAA